MKSARPVLSGRAETNLINMSEALPNFDDRQFDFGDDWIPDHVQELPLIPTYFRKWIVYGDNGYENYSTLAVDVSDEETAIYLAEAAARRQEQGDPEFYGYKDSICILSPKGLRITVEPGTLIEDNN
jgi:hypothetical protein